MASPSGKFLKTASSLKADLRKKNSEQLANIREKCDNNFELQMLVLKAIGDHSSAKLLTTQATLSAQILQDKKDKKEAQKHEVPDIDWTIVPQGLLRRGLLYFKHWGPELVFGLFCYVEEEMRQFGDYKNLPILKSSKEELMTFVFDVETDEGASDRVAVEEKLDLWPRMKVKYEEGGRRLCAILEHINDNHLDWSTIGFYKLVVEGLANDAQVMVFNRVTKQTSQIPPSLVAQTAQEFRSSILFNWSQKKAFVVINGETLCLGNFFKHQERSLKRSVSGSIGIVMPAAMAKRCRTGGTDTSMGKVKVNKFSKSNEGRKQHSLDKAVALASVGVSSTSAGPASTVLEQGIPPAMASDEDEA